MNKEWIHTFSISNCTYEWNELNWKIELDSPWGAARHPPPSTQTYSRILMGGGVRFVGPKSSSPLYSSFESRVIPIRDRLPSQG